MLRVEDSDSKTVKRLKLIYIIPVLFLLIVPFTLWYGIKEMIQEIPIVVKEIFSIARGQ
jgi:fructose-specific phosphotransferase system IIC component